MDRTLGRRPTAGRGGGGAPMPLPAPPIRTSFTNKPPSTDRVKLFDQTGLIGHCALRRQPAGWQSYVAARSIDQPNVSATQRRLRRGGGLAREAGGRTRSRSGRMHVRTVWHGDGHARRASIAVAPSQHRTRWDGGGDRLSTRLYHVLT
ncbi:hypothetical protein GUJ93_ZPchr0014g46925 [Zizania palustris]|uniref:Uncharacterized protein n=1 Tax=Zizania palustris TaxID=103762 RepID=A0A8J5T9B2_ZIZPA|nr:hypothetical protein GUJ93_ZPchr0014g46925 [Zizania palustris]